MAESEVYIAIYGVGPCPRIRVTHVEIQEMSVFESESEAYSWLDTFPDHVDDADDTGVRLGVYKTIDKKKVGGRWPHAHPQIRWKGLRRQR